MSRRRQADKRKILPDAKFANLDVSKFINILMLEGKKSVAEGIVYGAFAEVEKKANKPALEVFYEALDNIKPNLEVRSRRVGGATYQIPIEVRPERSLALAFRWLIGAARQRGEHTMMDRLSGEIIDALNNRGASVKKREETHKMAEANRAFAHYRW
ncbi:MAG: 30S ribosomal protein S7 [Alphaproteobacteria bacterium]